MFGVTPIVPAYGRDYKSKKALEDDLRAGKDFIAADGRYLSINDLIKLGLKRVEARYDQLRKVTVITL